MIRIDTWTLRVSKWSGIRMTEDQDDRFLCSDEVGFITPEAAKGRFDRAQPGGGTTVDDQGRRLRPWDNEGCDHCFKG
jgi:hypothetical protein